MTSVSTATLIDSGQRDYPRARQPGAERQFAAAIAGRIN